MRFGARRIPGLRMPALLSLDSHLHGTESTNRRADSRQRIAPRFGWIVHTVSLVPPLRNAFDAAGSK